jgi:hypothetical protein
VTSNQKSTKDIQSIDDALFEYYGTGDMILNANTKYRSDFKIRMLMNGAIIGDLRFTVNHLFIGSWSEKFILVGKINKNNLTLIASGCHFTYIHEDSSTNIIECTIKVRKLFVSPESNLLVPTGKLYFGVGVVNVSETFRVIVHSPMGNLQIAHFKDIFVKFKNLLRNFEAPIITSVLELETVPNGKTKTKDIVDKFKGIVKNFLKITSFAQLNNHQAVYFHVYEKDENERGHLLISELSSPSVGTTATPHLTNVAHSSNFINDAWNAFSNKGYSEELEKEYGFNSALYWLLESTTNNYFEPKFIDACTCLETLMDRFHSTNKTDLLLDGRSFKKLRKVLKKAASGWLSRQDYSSSTRKSISENLSMIQRRSFKDKANSLITQLNVQISDLDSTIDDVVKIRNRITHTGVSSVLDFEYQWKTYNDLMSILVRIFLAMIDYGGQYLDPWLDEWINFKERCIKKGLETKK